MGKARKKRRTKKPRPIDEEFAVKRPNAAGIDIGAKDIWVSVREERSDIPVRSYSALTPDLLELADWLEECGVDSVVMEATGVYWVPLYEILEERGFDVNLVNAQHVKMVPGRKSDVMDCQWLRKLHTFGLLNGSFRPTPEITQLRCYLRERDMLVRQAGDHVRRMQKALTLMNLRLNNVISDITGKTGMAILRAIVEGERDPVVLATHRDYRCRASLAKIRDSLTGTYRDEHLLALSHALSLYDICQTFIVECDEAATRLIDAINTVIGAEPVAKAPGKTRKKRAKKQPSVDYASRLHQLTGTDLTAVPGLADYSVACLIAEIGTDMSKWPTDGHFASWLRLVPRADITGGKPKSRRTMPTSNRATEILRMAAVNAGRTQTAIGAYYRRMAGRKEKGQAVVATAHKLARIIYAMLRDRTEFQDAGAAEWEAKHRERSISNLKRRAARLGLTLVEEAA